MGTCGESGNCKGDVMCPIPWKHVATKPSGEFRLCCLAQHSDSGFVHENGEAMRLIKDPLSSIRNSSIAKEVRQKMLAGEWHPTCKKCLDEETAGLKSRRIFYREMESDSDFAQIAQEKTLADGTIKHEDFPLETFDIRIGNLCNLKCRMCGPLYSTKWYSDYQKTANSEYFQNGEEKIYFSSREDLQRFQWHESDFFWNELFKGGHQIKHIYLIGGEPLIIKNQIEFLRRIVDAGFSKNIEIEYNSNMTVLPEEIISLWKEFKKVTIGISMESIYEENDYIRNPSKFQSIIENIKILDKHVSKNFRIWITTTFQMMNVFSLPKMIDWVENSDFEFINKFPNSPLIHIHPAHTPLYYSVQCLPKDAKLMAEEKLHIKIADLDRKFKATGFKKYDKTARKLENVIKFMNRVDLNQHFGQFLKITKQLDVIRKEDFQKTFPELSQAINYNSYTTLETTL